MPEEDVTKFPFKVELNFDAAILIIQNFETGRNNLKRIQKNLYSRLEGGDTNKKFISEEESRKLAYNIIIILEESILLQLED